MFLISQTSGKMYLRRPFDFDSMSDSVYNVTVEASDGELNSSAVITITVTDVNDNVPRCTPTFVNVTVDEDMPIGTNVSKFDICVRGLLRLFRFYQVDGCFHER